MTQPQYVAVYGASDDLIELRGAVEEEFNYQSGSHNDNEGDLLAFSDGTVLRIRHDAPWRITPVARGTAVLHVEQATDEEGTDKATLTGDIRWVVQGVAIEKAKS